MTPLTSHTDEHGPHRATGCRPRVEGQRESDILEAALELLGRVGYDNMTMDAVAAEARASKATLYRRWATKSSLVVDALLQSKQCLQVGDVDTGSLRADLVGLACTHGGLTDARSAHIMAGVITAVHHDPDFAAEFRTRVIGPKLATQRAVFERAQARGEISYDVDLDLLAPALAGIILHRSFVQGLPADEATVTRVIDQIILPAVTSGPSPRTTHPDHEGRP